MPGIAALTNEGRRALEEVVLAVEVPNLTKLVTLQTGYFTSHVYSPEWGKMSPDERGATDHDFRKEHIDDFDFTKKLTTFDGKCPHILQIYSPMVIPLPLAEDETYGKLKERIERLVAKQAEHIRINPFGAGDVNAYHLGDINLAYHIPQRVLRANVSCMPIAGDSFLSQPAFKLLKPRWTFTLTYFKIEQ